MYAGGAACPKAAPAEDQDTQEMIAGMVRFMLASLRPRAARSPGAVLPTCLAGLPCRSSRPHHDRTPARGVRHRMIMRVRIMAPACAQRAMRRIRISPVPASSLSSALPMTVPAGSPGRGLHCVAGSPRRGQKISRENGAERSVRLDGRVKRTRQQDAADPLRDGGHRGRHAGDRGIRGGRSAPQLAWMVRIEREEVARLDPFADGEQRGIVPSRDRRLPLASRVHAPATLG